MTITRRSLFGRLLGAAAVGAVGVGAEASTDAPRALPPTPRPSVITWPCVRCGEDNATPATVWPSVKFRLHCDRCGVRQPYLWHLKLFDPAPTTYGASPGHPLMELPRFVGVQHPRSLAVSRERQRIVALKHQLRLRQRRRIEGRLVTRVLPIPE